MPPLTRLQRRMRPLPSWNTHSTFSDSDDDDNSVTFPPSKQTSVVGFGCIEIREYSRELGGHDDIRNSLSLGWEYNQKEPIPVDEYHLSTSDLSESSPESSSSKQRRLSLLKKMSKEESSSSSLTSSSSSCGGEGNNKKGTITPMTTKQRRKILSEFGYSKHEIINQQEDRPREIGYGGCSSNELPRALKLVLKLC